MGRNDRVLTLAASRALACAQFLTYYYDTYPEKKPITIDATRSPPGAGATVVELEDDDKPPSPDVIPEFPNLPSSTTRPSCKFRRGVTARSSRRMAKSDGVPGGGGVNMKMNDVCLENCRPVAR